MAVRKSTGNSLSWLVDLNLKGHPRYRVSGFKSQEEALLHEAQVRMKFKTGESVIHPTTNEVVVENTDKNTPKTLGELLERVNERCWVDTRSAYTQYHNAQDVTNVIGSDRSPSSITASDADNVIAYFKKKSLSNSTINRKLAGLSKMLSFALERGWISRKPKFESLKAAKGRTRWVTDDEELIMERYSKQFPHYVSYNNLWFFLMDTGLRLSEALALDIKDVSHGSIHVWENKADEPRTIPMTERVKKIVEECPELFKGITKNTARHRWDNMKSMMGLENDTQFVIHCLRHTFCSRLVQKGVSILVVQQLAGHKDIKTTMRYSHLSKEALRHGISVLNK